jgi:hypothetical protein
MAKTKTNAIIVFDAFIFVELLHKSFSQHVVLVVTKSKVMSLAVHVAAHDETAVLTEATVEVTFF